MNKNKKVIKKKSNNNNINKKRQNLISANYKPKKEIILSLENNNKPKNVKQKNKSTDISKRLTNIITKNIGNSFGNDKIFVSKEYIRKRSFLNTLYKKISDTEEAGFRFLYSDKFSHIYLYDIINNETILNVKKKIDKYQSIREHITDDNKTIYTLPKPIVLHLNSPGGDFNAGVALSNIIHRCQVPVVVIGEGIIASAATFVLITANLRYISPYSVVLIHQYSSEGSGKHEQLKFESELGEVLMDQMINMYTKYTTLKKNQVLNILKHDLYLSSDDVIKFNMVNGKTHQIDTYDSYYKEGFIFYGPEGFKSGITYHNTINMYKSEKEDKEYSPYNRSLHIVKHIHSMTFFTNSIPLFFNFNDQVGVDYFSSFIEVAPVLNAIAISNVPMYGLIDGPIKNFTILILLFLAKNYIYERSYVVIDFIEHETESYKFENSISNTNFIRRIIKDLFKKRSKLPNKILDNLFKKRFFLDHHDCVKYGLASEFIRS